MTHGFDIEGMYIILIKNHKLLTLPTTQVTKIFTKIINI